MDCDSKIGALSTGCDTITMGIEELKKAEITSDDLRSSSDEFTALKIKLDGLKERYETVSSTMKSSNTNVMFIGRISTGKSRIINGLIRRNILLSAATHTTRTFIKISKSPRDVKSLTLHSQMTKTYRKCSKIKRRLNDFTHQLIDRNEVSGQEIEILLPSRISPLIQKHVYLYDTPGFGTNGETIPLLLDKCKVADILVFVMNYNITSESDRLFETFQQYTSAIPTFVLINKWDSIDNDDDTDLNHLKSEIERCIIERVKTDKNEINTELGPRNFYISGEEICKYYCRKSVMNIFKHTTITLQGKMLERHKEYKEFMRNLLNSIEQAPEHKKERCILNYEQIMTELNKLKMNFNDERNILIEILEEYVKQFNKYLDDLMNLKNDLEQRIDQLDYKIEVIKNEQIHRTNNEMFLKRINDLNEEFNAIYTRCDCILNRFMLFMPNKKKIIQRCCSKIESLKRRIIELNAQIQGSQEYMTTAMVVVGGAAATGIGMAALGFTSALFFPVAIAAGAAYAASTYYHKKNEDERRLEELKNHIIDNSDKYRDDLSEAYTTLQVAIFDSNIEKDCEKSLDILNKFFKRIEEDQRQIENAFYN